jgi:hypothetical protein
MQEDNNKDQININNSPELKETRHFVRYTLVAVIFSIIFFFVGDIYRSRNMQIKYISQSEILKLEQDRLSALNLKDRQLFFGKPEQAIKYIEQIQKDMSKKRTIILLADSKIYGNDVSSISKEVHLQIIERLKWR